MDLDGTIDQGPYSLMESNLAQLKDQVNQKQKRGSVKNKREVPLKTSQKDVLNKTENQIGAPAHKFDDSNNFLRQKAVNCFIEDLCNCDEEPIETVSPTDPKKKHSHVISNSA